MRRSKRAFVTPSQISLLKQVNADHGCMQSAWETEERSLARFEKTEMFLLLHKRGLMGDAP
jgi:hypothetical protein